MALASPSRRTAAAVVARAVPVAPHRYVAAPAPGAARRHAAFLARLARRVPAVGLPREELRRVVWDAGGGRYRLRYGAVHAVDAAQARRALTYAP
jgi:hypothetical protein